MNNPTDPFAQDWLAATQEIENLLFDTTTFLSASFSFKVPIGPEDNAELKIRTVEVRHEINWQFSQGSSVQNYSRKKAKLALRDLFQEFPLSQAHVMTSEMDLHLRIAKKGRVLLSRSKKQLNRSMAPTHAHNREKDYPLTRFDATALLRILGLADSQGTLKPSMHAKYRQVNEFLRILEASLTELNLNPDTPLQIVDVGCGKAYLSFAAKAYLEQVKKISVHLTLIDIRAANITACMRIAEALECTSSTTCITSDIATVQSRLQPDIVLSLHACDTATDEALAFGVEHHARVILCAPCCQHELQGKLPSTGSHQAILRNGILKERLADILTDAFRAQILRIMGYRTQVIEFIDSDATARNILIRGTRAFRPGQQNAVGEYQSLQEAWHCTPYLAERLAALCPDLLPPSPLA